MLAGIAIYVLLRPTEAQAVTLLLDLFPILIFQLKNAYSKGE